MKYREVMYIWNGTIVRKKVKTYLISCLEEEIENEGVKVLGHELE